MRKELKKIPGIKIRRQNFDYLYWGSVIFGASLTSVCLFGSSLLENIKYIFLCGVVFLIVALPVFLNRFFFGQVVCVINEQGIYYYHGFIEWKAIEVVEFDIETKARALTATNIHIISKSKKSRVLYNTPYSAIRVMKRYKKSIRRVFTERAKEILIFSSVFAGILVLLLPLFLFLLKVFS